MEEAPIMVDAVIFCMPDEVSDAIGFEVPMRMALQDVRAANIPYFLYRVAVFNDADKLWHSDLVNISGKRLSELADDKRYRELFVKTERSICIRFQNKSASCFLEEIEDDSILLGDENDFIELEFSFFMEDHTELSFVAGIHTDFRFASSEDMVKYYESKDFWTDNAAVSDFFLNASLTGCCANKDKDGGLHSISIFTIEQTEDLILNSPHNPYSFKAIPFFLEDDGKHPTIKELKGRLLAARTIGFGED